MTHVRQLFQFNTDTGTQTLESRAINGELTQMRWAPSTADTGADLSMGVYPNAADTGDGWLFYNNNDVLGTGFTIVPMQSVSSNLDGTTDTGAAPIVFAGDALRVTVTPGGAACAGTLYVWTKN